MLKSRIGMFIALLVVAVILLAQKAQAVLVTLSSGQSATFLYDGATASPSCALCDATVTLTFNGTSLTIEFKNTSTDGTSPANVNILTSFAFNTTPNLTFDASSASFTGLPSGKSWSFATTGLGSFEFGSTSNNGITGGLDAGESGNLVVNITNNPTPNSLAIDLTETHFQAINTVGGTSTKPQGCLSTDPNCDGTADTTDTPVPEPSALVLLGAGLIALRGFVKRLN